MPLPCDDVELIEVADDMTLARDLAVEPVRVDDTERRGACCFAPTLWRSSTLLAAVLFSKAAAMVWSNVVGTDTLLELWIVEVGEAQGEGEDGEGVKHDSGCCCCCCCHSPADWT